MPGHTVTAKLTEAQREERLIRAKGLLLFQQSVLRHWYDGITVRQSAEMLSTNTWKVQIWRHRLQLGRLVTVDDSP